METPHFFLIGEWGGRSLTPQTVGRRFVRTLDGLSAIDPVFERWGVVDNERLVYLHLDSVRNAMTEVIQMGAMEGHGRKNRFTGRHGFDARAMTIGFDAAHTFSVGIREGNYRNDVNSVALGSRYVEPLDLSLVTPTLFRPALKLLIEIWRPRSMIVSCYLKSGDFLTDLGTPHLRFHNPWMAYLPERTLQRANIPTGLHVELAGRGAILSASYERMDLGIAEHLNASAQIRDILVKQLGDRRKR